MVETEERAKVEGIGEVPPAFEIIKQSIYLCTRPQVEKALKCYCSYDPSTDNPEDACGESCLNRATYIECNPNKCPCGEHCQNQRIQKSDFKPIEVFKTEKKGWGVRSLEDIPAETFVIEYSGDVVDKSQFLERVQEYDSAGSRHYYFMNLTNNIIIDATKRGNNSRYLNHGCEPNCVTQKWHVNGELRIGLFTKQHVQKGEELTFDYKFERYGQKAQECYCGSSNCRGTLGGARNVSQLSDSSRMTSLKKRMRSGSLKMEEVLDLNFEDQMEYLTEDGELRDKSKILAFTHLWLEFVDLGSEHRFALVSVVAKTSDEDCLKEFVKYRGLGLLRLIWNDSGATSELRDEILNTLLALPVPNQNIVGDSQLLPILKSNLKSDDSLKDKIETILEKWEKLPKKYVIPKRAKPKSSVSYSGSGEPKETKSNQETEASTPNGGRTASSISTPGDRSTTKTSPYVSGAKRTVSETDRGGDRGYKRRSSYSEDRYRSSYGNKDRSYDKDSRDSRYGDSNDKRWKTESDKHYDNRRNDRSDDRRPAENSKSSCTPRAPLPPDWEEYKDESSGSNYYYNRTTGKTTWDRPSASKVSSLAERPIRSALAGLSNSLFTAKPVLAFTQDAAARKDESREDDRKRRRSRDESSSSHKRKSSDSKKKEKHRSDSQSKNGGEKEISSHKDKQKKSSESKSEIDKEKIKEFQKKAHHLLYNYMKEKYMDESCEIARVTCKEDQKYLSHKVRICFHSCTSFRYSHFLNTYVSALVFN